MSTTSGWRYFVGLMPSTRKCHSAQQTAAVMAKVCTRDETGVVPARSMGLSLDYVVDRVVILSRFVEPPVNHNVEENFIAL